MFQPIPQPSLRFHTLVFLPSHTDFQIETFTFIENKDMNWEIPNEKNEPAEEKQVCNKCGNDTFRVYIKIIIDDARLYCVECGEPLL